MLVESHPILAIYCYKKMTITIQRGDHSSYCMGYIRHKNTLITSIYFIQSRNNSDEESYQSEPISVTCIGIGLSLEDCTSIGIGIGKNLQTCFGIGTGKTQISHYRYRYNIAFIYWYATYIIIGNISNSWPYRYWSEP